MSNINSAGNLVISGNQTVLGNSILGSDNDNTLIVNSVATFNNGLYTTNLVSDSLLISENTTFNGIINNSSLVQNGISTFNNDISANNITVDNITVDNITVNEGVFNNIISENSTFNSLINNGSSTFNGSVIISDNISANEGVFNNIISENSTFNGLSSFNDSVTISNNISANEGVFNNIISENSTFNSLINNGSSVFNDDILVNQDLNLKGPITIDSSASFENYSVSNFYNTTTFHDNVTVNGNSNSFNNSVSFFNPSQSLPLSVSSQAGLSLYWNVYNSINMGETTFLNHAQNYSNGGFNFANISASNTIKNLVLIDSNGNISCKSITTTSNSNMSGIINSGKYNNSYYYSLKGNTYNDNGTYVYTYTKNGISYSSSSETFDIPIPDFNCVIIKYCHETPTGINGQTNSMGYHEYIFIKRVSNTPYIWVQKDGTTSGNSSVFQPTFTTTSSSITITFPTNLLSGYFVHWSFSIDMI